MAVFAIVFRVQKDANYECRYQSLVDEVKKQNTGKYFWDETTSLILIESDKSSADLCTTFTPILE